MPNATVRANAPAYFSDPDSIRPKLLKAGFRELRALQDALLSARDTLVGYLAQPRVAGDIEDIIEEYTEHFFQISQIVSDVASCKKPMSGEEAEVRGRIILMRILDTDVLWPEIVGTALEVLSARGKINISVEGE